MPNNEKIRYLANFRFVQSDKNFMKYFIPSSYIVTPHVCTRGKAIGLPERPSVVVDSTKITISHVLGICARCKHNQLVDISEKYTLRIAKGLLVLQIVHFLSACLWFIDCMLKLSVGKGHQVMKHLCSRVLRYICYSG